MIHAPAKFAFALSLIVSTAFANPSPRFLPGGVGPGGDLVDRLLAIARASLVETLTKIETGTDTATLCHCTANSAAADPSCRYLQSLTDAQQNYCQAFILRTASRIRALASPGGTGFSLSDSVLTVPDPQGVQRRVLAVTDLGSTGDITFYYDGIKDLAPMSLLALIGHEFGHKVWFPFPGMFVQDNPKTGPFDADGGGRAFLDSIGAGLAIYAVQHALVPQYTSLFDRFICSVTETTLPTNITVTGRSQRLYLDPSWVTYQTGVGNLPRDMSCCNSENGGATAVCLRLEIHEPNNCGPLSDRSLRWTRVELTRSYAAKAGRLRQPTDKLGHRLITGWTPVCDKEVPMPLSLDYSTPNRHYVMEVLYDGVAPSSAVEE